MCDKCLQSIMLLLKIHLEFRVELLLAYRKWGGCRNHTVDVA